ncbi:hypothetical protein EWE75_04635 [Sphingomonas populi]|uniref:Uncharacterized protein n=1 Tax=Sphingomonas populi TaxID=2484750 RepID=A0A4Q6XYN5_9SPHN|nr:hypothetical protein [Sphingomonas populi]RZF65590.1 hypothetical protein EWE75_04635 [Sphingomonas populi]
MKRLILAGVLALGGCGSASELKPASNQHLPVAPYSARATPTATQLLTPNSQARPERSDELLKKSDTRRGDEFDLPPHN